MSELYCTNCGKLHESESEFCEYCGYDLKVALQRFKERKEQETTSEIEESIPIEKEEKEATGMEFYEQIKRGEKKRSRFEDPLKEKKVRRIPSNKVKWAFRILFILTTVISCVSLFLMLHFFDSDFFDYFFGAFMIVICLFPIILIPFVIIESRVKTRGRSSCSCEGYRSTPDCSGCGDCGQCAECANCNAIFSGISFIINLVFLLFSRKK